PAPCMGAPPCDGNGLAAAAAPPAGGNGEACAGAPLTGGNGEELAGCADWFGSGAGNAPCAPASPAWRATTATVSGVIRRRMIKGMSPARSRGAPTSSGQNDSDRAAFYDPWRALTTHGIGQQRGTGPQYLPRILIL